MSILIIGAGFAGLGMAIRLKRAGIHDFTILERADDIGGTWRDNDYPGCACDVQSHLYSYSFEPNPEWTRMFAPQAEILRYMHHCVDKYELRPHIRFNQNMQRARYDDARALWCVETATDHFEAPLLIGGFGPLSNPVIPELPGRDSFEGVSFHSAGWRHDYDLSGKRVAVVGTGASAIQFVPAIVDRVAHLDLYQRTPPWVLPKSDRPISARERALFKRAPFAQRLMRRRIYWALEARVLGMVVNPKLMKMVEREALAYIERKVDDPELRAKVTPNYTIGCKRILLSNDWYDAVAHENLQVVTSGIQRITPRGVVTADGVERPADVIIYGTGFDVKSPIPPNSVFGRDGLDLTETWNGTPQAYKGSTVAGFPNFFFIGGPNTGLGHSSMIYMFESQFAYILDAILKMREQGWRTIEVKPEDQASYNEKLQKQSVSAVWLSGCRSWYLDENGRNFSIWPRFTFEFRRQCAHFDSRAYRAEAGAPPI